MKKYPTLKETMAYCLYAFAIILTATKGTLDWMGLAIIAVILQLPGTRWIRDLFKKIARK